MGGRDQKGGGRLFEFELQGEGGGVGLGRLFEAGRLLNFSAFRMCVYSRWALIRGWALIRINTVYNIILTLINPVSTFTAFSSFTQMRKNSFTKHDDDIIYFCLLKSQTSVILNKLNCLYALSFSTDSKMDVLKTIIIVFLILFPVLIKGQQNLQGNG